MACDAMLETHAEAEATAPASQLATLPGSWMRNVPTFCRNCVPICRACMAVDDTHAPMLAAVEASHAATFPGSWVRNVPTFCTNCMPIWRACAPNATAYSAIDVTV